MCFFPDKSLNPTFPVLIKTGFETTKCYNPSFGPFGWCGTADDNSKHDNSKHDNSKHSKIKHDKNWGFCLTDCNEE